MAKNFAQNFNIQRKYLKYKKGIKQHILLDLCIIDKSTKIILQTYFTYKDKALDSSKAFWYLLKVDLPAKMKYR